MLILTKINILRNLLLSIITCFAFQCVSEAQDIHFTQYNSTPLLTNPASSGFFNEYWRLGFNYREQWNRIAIPYKTMNFFYDRQLYIHNIHFSLGAHVLIDQITVKGLNKNYVAPTLAYHLKLKKNMLSFGIQPGIGIYRFNTTTSFPDQYDEGTGFFNPSITSAEVLDNSSSTFFDFSAGINFSREIFQSVSSVGFAVYHLNRPGYAFITMDAAHRLPVKAVMNLLISIPVSDNAFIQPNALALRQDQSQEIITGIDYIFITEKIASDIKYLFIGPHFRTARAEGLHSLIIKAGFKYKRFRFGVNYDSYFSSSAKASSLGSTMELSLIFTGINNFRELDIFPCDRF